MSFLTLNNINKSYKGINVLNNINLSFDINEFVFILGESGSGKTTLLNIIGLLVKQDNGKILINDKLVKNNSKVRFNYYSYVFQNDHLLDYYNIKDNINLSLLNISKDQEDINKITKTLHINDKLNTYPNNISGGEKQRAAIARCLIKEPKIILADEPTGSLDSKNATNFFETLNANKEGHLIIVVTHNKVLAEKYATRIITLENGTVKEDRLINENKLIDYGEPSFYYKKLTYKKIFRIVINAIKLNYKWIIGSMIISSLLMFICGGVFALRSGIDNYVYHLENVRLDNRYINIYHYKNEEITNDDYLTMLNKNGFALYKFENLDYIFNSYFLDSSLLNSNYEYSIIDFNLLTSYQKNYIVSDQENFKVLINNAFKEEYDVESFSINKTLFINETTQTLKTTINIDGYVNEGNLYNSPKIYMDYNYALSLLDQNIVETLLHNDDQFIPYKLFIRTSLNDFYTYLKDNDFYYLTNKSEKEDYYIYESSIGIIKTALDDLISSCFKIFILISVVIIICSISLLSLMQTYLINKRIKEFMLIKAFGCSNNDIFNLIFCECFIESMYAYLVTLSLMYMTSKIIYSQSNNILNENYKFNLFEIEPFSLSCNLYLSIVISIISTSIIYKIITKKDFKEVMDYE